MKTRRFVVFSDVHVPYHCSKNLSLVYDVIEEMQFDDIYINGDFLDMVNISMHGPKHPAIIDTLEDEFAAGRELLQELRDRNPKARIVFRSGNHCQRLDRFIIQHCKPFWNILTVEKQLNLESMNIEWQPYNDAHRMYDTTLYLQHSPASYSVNAARTNLQKKPAASFIYGCTHRPDFATQPCSHDDNNFHQVIINGWLGSKTESEQHRQVFSYAKGHTNWSRSIVTGVIIDDKDFMMDLNMIKNGRIMVDGHLFEV